MGPDFPLASARRWRSSPDAAALILIYAEFRRAQDQPLRSPPGMLLFLAWVLAGSQEEGKRILLMLAGRKCVIKAIFQLCGWGYVASHAFMKHHLTLLRFDMRVREPRDLSAHRAQEPRW